MTTSGTSRVIIIQPFRVLTLGTWGWTWDHGDQGDRGGNVGLGLTRDRHKRAKPRARDTASALAAVAAVAAVATSMCTSDMYRTLTAIVTWTSYYRHKHLEHFQQQHTRSINRITTWWGTATSIKNGRFTFPDHLDLKRYWNNMKQ